MSASKIIVPVVLGAAFLIIWEMLVRLYAVPLYVLPPPTAIAAALTANFSSLMEALWNTLTITLEASIVALIAGVTLAVLFSQSRILERALYPYAVILQVTPIFAIAPLVLIWVGYERVDLAQLILASTVAFFPVLTNMTLGLRAADRNLVDLFRLYGASRWQMLVRLNWPAALPYLLTSTKVAVGLALVGTIVAEFVAGSGTDTGLGWRIIESGNRLEIPKMFAALLLIAALGLVLFWSLSLAEWAVLRRWHESHLRDGT
jgi:NitT/TauT family transport system permease protein